MKFVKFISLKQNKRVFKIKKKEYYWSGIW